MTAPVNGSAHDGMVHGSAQVNNQVNGQVNGHVNGVRS